MKTLAFLLTLCFMAVSAYAENNLLGKWTDKSNPGQQTFEFLKGHDIIYTYTWVKDGKAMSNERKGVWETGSWMIITKLGDIKQPCNLVIYLDDDECCFDYKFISKNLILSKRFSGNPYGSLCDNKVLIRAK